MNEGPRGSSRAPTPLQHSRHAQSARRSRAVKSAPTPRAHLPTAGDQDHHAPSSLLPRTSIRAATRFHGRGHALPLPRPRTLAGSPRRSRRAATTQIPRPTCSTLHGHASSEPLPRAWAGEPHRRSAFRRGSTLLPRTGRHSPRLGHGCPHIQRSCHAAGTNFTLTEVSHVSRGGPTLTRRSHAARGITTFATTVQE